MKAKCIAMYRKMSEYLDHECDEATREKVEAHLEECRECGDCLESIRRTIALSGVLPQEPIPDEVRSSLREVLNRCMEEQR
jgi:anti-sigma factor RsiW